MSRIRRKEILLKLQLTVAEVARRTGRSRRTIHKYLNDVWTKAEGREAIQAVLDARAKELCKSTLRMWPATPSHSNRQRVA